MKNNAEILLQDMTYNTSYELLDYGANKDEIDAIAKRRGIRLPSQDLAIFKSRYAFVDRQNKNGCTLPRVEVEKALDTLVGKAVDFDHLRKRVVGHWIDATLQSDEIIAYGVFFKSNFADDYDTIKELMNSGVLAISFEAWGNREMKEDGGYNLNDIEFAGGALLLKEEPAFPGSKVLDMAKAKVLEFAKVMTAPEKFVHIGEEAKKDKIEKDNELEEKRMSEERIKALEEEVASLKTQIEEKDKVITSKDEEIAKVKDELEKSSKVVEELKKESEEAKIKIEEVQKDVDKKIEEAKAEAIKLTERKAELGDFAKDVADADVLNDDKYENLKLKKSLKEKDDEIAKLKVDKKDEKHEDGTEKGSKDKGVVDKTKEKSKKVRGLAFGEE